MAKKKQRWIDLSAQGIYLGSIKMADGIERLALIDMQDSVKPERLRAIGFLPFERTPRYDRGIYYLAADQGLAPSSLAAAIGIGKCPIIDVDPEEIDAVFRDKCMEKFQANLNAVTLRTEVLGQNRLGQFVYQSPAGRFVRTGKSEAITESSAEGTELGRAMFLRAENDVELRECAEGFLHPILSGKKSSWNDVVRFAKAVFGHEASDGELHRLQEAIEAAAYRAFSGSAYAPDEAAFRLASDFYFGLPVARMRTSESVFLQQYSTPLPMSVVMQRLLIGHDNMAGKTLLDPAGGNGGLLNLLPEGMKVCAVDLDENRVAAMAETKRIHAEVGDATHVPLRALFGEPDGFDYTTANPPFGSMEKPQAFDKIPAVRRLDHYIALRALQARKDHGRSTIIVGADSAQSDGTVKGGARSFLNYIHDHYEVHGCVELDGRMYTRHGAGYNVRMIVVGDRLAVPRVTQVPERLPVLTSYEELWQWSGKVIEAYAAPRPEVAMDGTKKPVPQVGDVVIVRGGRDAGSVRTLLGKTATGFMVSDTTLGRIEVPDVEYRRNTLARVGQRVRFEPHDLADPLAGGVVEGLVVDVADTSGNHFRYRIRTDVAAPQGGGNIERLVYSHQGRITVMQPELGVDALRVVITGEAPLAVPDGWIVMNAPRPLVGSDTRENGEFLTGRFYAMVDPADPMAARFVEENRKLAASVVLVASREEQVAMALTGNEYRDRYYSEMGANERYNALQGQISRLNEMTFGEARALLEQARSYLAERMVEVSDPAVDSAALGVDAVPAFTTDANPPAMAVEVQAQAAVVAAPQRHVNEFQVPYQSASKVGLPSAMVPINMAGATYAALNDLEAEVGPIDDYVSAKLKYSKEQLGEYFSVEQIDALGLAIRSVENGRGVIEADQTGLGKGRFVAAMMRYAKLNDIMPVFMTIKPELFTDIFRDIEDIGSRDLFNKLFIFNEGVHVMKFGTEDQILYRATSPQERKQALETMTVDPTTDMVLATYSQFQRAAAKNAKARLLGSLSMGKTMLFLDESHVASGESNIGLAVGEAVANCESVVYASATPLKGVKHFAIYSKVFPASVDLKTLPDTLKAGGEALLEAISANMARDGVLIRREHDFSQLTFVTRIPDDKRRDRNIELANKLSQVLAAMSFLSGDVSAMVNDMNKQFEKDWEKIPESERSGMRMRASSMNFGSRLYAINRQFLMGIKIEDSVEAALQALQEGRKPVIAVENTGESLLRQVLSRRAGVEELEKQLDELDQRTGQLSPEDKAKREQLVEQIGEAIRGVRLEEPPQFRELLDIMLDRIGEIKVMGRYGDYATKQPESKEYEKAEKSIRKMVDTFPDLPLMPLDVLKDELGRRGFAGAEVSGRTASLERVEEMWAARFHPKADAVAQVAGFQNGKYEWIAITRSGSTGISLHATDRFADSDIRQRDFIVLQKAANIAEFLQWLGRVNRKDQVCPPIITTLESGLPAELRLTMMHNAKLRKLSANTTSNRENSNVASDNMDLLNDVGDTVALEWLCENPDIAGTLNIDLPKDADDEVARFSQDCPYINKLLGRLMMVDVPTQERILNTLSQRFADTVNELEQRGENPFKIDVFEWGAKVVKEEELQSGVLRASDSTFDEAVKLVTLEYEQEVKPIRSKRLLEMIAFGNDHYATFAPLDDDKSLNRYAKALRELSEDALRRQLPVKFKDSELSIDQIIATGDAGQVQKAKEKQQFLLRELTCFKPGAYVVYEDLFKGEVKGIVTRVHFPSHRDEAFILSKYTMEVAFPGQEATKEISLATLFNQSQSLSAHTYRAIDLEKIEKMAYAKTQAMQVLKPYDEAPDGKVTRRAHVLQGNIFRACELAYQQRLGAPILFSDHEGNRQRAVLLRDNMTPDKVKSLPIGLDAQDMCDYIDEFLRPDHPDYRSRCSYGALRIFDIGVKEMKKGEGVMLEVLNGGRAFRLSMPGTKSAAGRLMTDGSIFDIGKETPPGSMRLRLAGTRSSMSVDVNREQLPELMRKIQANGHVGKFYLPDPKQEVLKALKARYAQESENTLAA